MIYQPDPNSHMKRRTPKLRICRWDFETKKSLPQIRSLHGSCCCCCCLMVIEKGGFPRRDCQSRNCPTLFPLLIIGCCCCCCCCIDVIFFWFQFCWRCPCWGSRAPWHRSIDMSASTTIRVYTAPITPRRRRVIRSLLWHRPIVSAHPSRRPQQRRRRRVLLDSRRSAR